MMPDRTQITHQDPMTAPDFRALCVELLQAMIAQDLRSRGLAEQVAGEELLRLANSSRFQIGPLATPPALQAGEVEA